MAAPVLSTFGDYYPLSGFMKKVAEKILAINLDMLDVRAFYAGG
jgi:hypothetical protein